MTRSLNLIDSDLRENDEANRLFMDDAVAVTADPADSWCRFSDRNDGALRNAGDPDIGGCAVAMLGMRSTVRPEPRGYHWTATGLGGDISKNAA